MIELSDVYVMEGIRPVDVVCLDMWKMPKDTRDRPRLGGPKPVLGDLHCLMAASSFGILVPPIILLEGH
jgi:hypothetical protein